MDTTRFEETETNHESTKFESTEERLETTESDPDLETIATDFDGCGDDLEDGDIHLDDDSCVITVCECEEESDGTFFCATSSYEYHTADAIDYIARLCNLDVCL